MWHMFSQSGISNNGADWHFVLSSHYVKKLCCSRLVHDVADLGQTSHFCYRDFAYQFFPLDAQDTRLLDTVYRTYKELFLELTGMPTR